MSEIKLYLRKMLSRLLIEELNINRIRNNFPHQSPLGEPKMLSNLTLFQNHLSIIASTSAFCLFVASNSAVAQEENDAQIVSGSDTQLATVILPPKLEVDLTTTGDSGGIVLRDRWEKMKRKQEECNYCALNQPFPDGEL